MKEKPKYEEDRQQVLFIRWLNDMMIDYSAIPQSTFTRSGAALNRNKKLGVKPGIPDMLLAIPSQYRDNGQRKLVFVEMKREKGSSTSPEQKKWISILGECESVDAMVCKGALAAIEFVSQFIEIPPEKMGNFDPMTYQITLIKNDNNN